MRHSKIPTIKGWKEKTLKGAFGLSMIAILPILLFGCATNPIKVCDDMPKDSEKGFVEFYVDQKDAVGCISIDEIWFDFKKHPLLRPYSPCVKRKWFYDICMDNNIFNHTKTIRIALAPGRHDFDISPTTGSLEDWAPFSILVVKDMLIPVRIDKKDVENRPSMFVLRITPEAPRPYINQ